MTSPTVIPTSFRNPNVTELDQRHAEAVRDGRGTMMRGIVVALAMLALCAMAARADCPTSVAGAMARAEKLPPSLGRAALMEQIQRADIAHHEGDDGECAEQLQEATAVLDKIDEAKRAAVKDPAPNAGAATRP